MGINTSVGKILTMKQGGAFKDYIDYIRFPFFRNLVQNTRIDFDFPFTVFVGQNGCGKSSTLQALYGCPKGKSVGTYWFNTHVDPIEEFGENKDKDRHCLIYSYANGGLDKEVLKTRINKAGQPDLWDTSEPINRYKMKMGDRTPPVEKEVIYINFRSQQNAFEKAFHSQRPPGWWIQEHLRGRSWYLDRILRGKTIPHFQGKTHDPIADLTADELLAVGTILGRTYKKATLIKHRIFDHWGYSVILKTEHASYSEAFAGSGETAVVVLVKEVLQSPKNSLMLFDEPETSLHPGAQTKILEFLLDQCIKHQHQIVICSHAPALVQELPKSAIKVFTPTPDGKFQVENEMLPQEAFFFLGQPVENKKNIIVEDGLAKILVDEILTKLGDATKNLFEVSHYHGGASQMKQEAALYSRNQLLNVFLLFDGDQKPDEEIYDPANMKVGIDADPIQAIAFLDEKIKNATGANIHFASDGHNGIGDKPQQKDLRKQFLKYCKSNFFFLPMNTPEKEIWNDVDVEKFLGIILSPKDVGETKIKLEGEPDFKKRFVVLTEALCSKSSGIQISVIHTILVKAWIKNNSPSVQEMSQLLEQIKNK